MKNHTILWNLVVSFVIGVGIGLNIDSMLLQTVVIPRDLTQNKTVSQIGNQHLKEIEKVIGNQDTAEEELTFAYFEKIYNERIDGKHIAIDDEIQRFKRMFEYVARRKNDVVQPNAEQIIKQTCPMSYDWSRRRYKPDAMLTMKQYGEFIQDKIHNQKCGERDSISDFICKAQCAIEEPELERTMRVLRVAQHSVQDIVNHCLTMVSPIMIWIHDGKIQYLNCFRRREGSRWRELPMEGVNPWNEITRLLKIISCLVDLPNNIVFGFDSQDWVVPTSYAPHESYQYMVQLPGIARLVGTRAHDGLLFPTGSHLTSTSHCHLRADREFWIICDFEPKVTKVPWSGKNRTIVWRGLDTGDCCSVTNNQRVLLTKKFGARSAFAKGQGARRVQIDVGIVGNPKMNTKFETEIGYSNKIRKHDHVNYRYLLHVDGNTASWGSTHKLNNGSTVLIAQSRRSYLEYYYAFLKPWIHYIPIDADFGNLEYIQRWLGDPLDGFDNDKKAERIAGNARKLFTRRMRAQDVHCYVTRLIYSIAAAQTVGPPATPDYLQTLIPPEVMKGFVDIDHDLNMDMPVPKK